MHSVIHMENEIPVKSTNQLLIQHISEAAVFTNTSFVIMACNNAASALLNFRQQEVIGLDITSLTFSASTTLSLHPSIKDNVFTQGVIEYINSNNQKVNLHITRHAIAPDTDNGG